MSSVISLFLFLLFFVLTYSWPFLPGSVLLNQTINQTMDASNNISVTQETIACHGKDYSWCENLKPINHWLFYASYVLLVGSAFPILNITLPTILSILLDSKNQGTQQGILQMSGSIARMLGPILLR